MTPPHNDATTALVRALRAHIGEAQSLYFDEIRSRSWASATFVGARHEIALRLVGPQSESAADAFVDTLDVAEFGLRGHILADIALVSRQCAAEPDGASAMLIRIEALTVEDC